MVLWVTDVILIFVVEACRDGDWCAEPVFRLREWAHTLWPGCRKWVSHCRSCVPVETWPINSWPMWLLGERCERREPARYTNASDHWPGVSWPACWWRAATTCGRDFAEWAEAMGVSPGEWCGQAFYHSEGVEAAWVGRIFSGESSSARWDS